MFLTTLLETGWSKESPSATDHLLAPFPEAYALAGLPWMKVGISVGAIMFLVPTAYIRLVAGADVIVRVADDGLLMEALGSTEADRRE